MVSRTMETARGPVAIRTTVASDAEALLALRLEALAKHPTAFGADVESTHREGIEVWRGRAERGGGEGNTAIIVASAGEGGLVGITGIIQGSRVKDARSAFIWGVYVTEEWRGLGLSGAMMDSAMEWARSRGVKLVRLTVMCENEAAVQSYLRCGFRITGLSVGEIDWEGEFYDEILMCKWV